MKNAVSRTVLSKDSYKAIAFSRSHEMHMDRPLEEEGGNTSATPIEYLLAAIGGCVSMTLRVFANKKGWNLGEITVKVTQKNKLTSNGLTTSLIDEISFEKEVTEVQKRELLIWVEKCPVAQLVKKETLINSKII
jgi:putative redox protein